MATIVTIQVRANVIYCQEAANVLVKLAVTVVVAAATVAIQVGTIVFVEIAAKVDVEAVATEVVWQPIGSIRSSVFR